MLWHQLVNKLAGPRMWAQRRFPAPCSGERVRNGSGGGEQGKSAGAEPGWVGGVFPSLLESRHRPSPGRSSGQTELQVSGQRELQMGFTANNSQPQTSRRSVNLLDAGCQAVVAKQ